MTTLARILPSLRRRVTALRVVFTFSFLAAALSAAPVDFNLAEQPATTALPLFTKQSGRQVMFVHEELEDVRTPALHGKYEPEAAIALLLKGTGFTATVREHGWISVGRDAKAATTGVIRGSLDLANGSPAAGVGVFILGENQQIATADKFGQFVFDGIAPGTYTLAISLEGYQPLRITGVVVRANRETTIAREILRKANGSQEAAVVSAESLIQLSKFKVTDKRPEPFAAGDMDIPRTMDDAQAYYIFDAKTIETSGNTSIEDFLKQHLTMNTVTLSNGQYATSTAGNTSTVNLRGLGADKTLVLVNGRRMAGVVFDDSNNSTSQQIQNQPDVNGIPMSAIDRIEILPSSASGIYGGNAIGGVVNIILKKNYSGGEVRLNYDNTTDKDAPTRSAALSYGFSLEGGRTHVMMNAVISDASPMLLQDRAGIFNANIATILKNSPSWFSSTNSPYLGSLTNIAPYFGQTVLKLKTGDILPVASTFVPAGTSNATSAADLAAGLLANSGKWDYNNPPSTQSPNGLLRPLATTPKNRAFRMNVSRQMLPWLDLSADFSYAQNKTASVINVLSSGLTISSASVINPFTANVIVRFPDATQAPSLSSSTAASAALGAIIKLPWKWTADLDYAWSESRFGYSYYALDNFAYAPDINSGLLNPFVDTLAHPLNMARYLSPFSFNGKSSQDDFSLRGTGPLPSLPWGRPDLTFGLERRIAHTPGNIYQQNFPITIKSDIYRIYLPRDQTTDSAYVETLVPLVKRDWLPFVHSLDLQLAGRSEKFTVDNGTATYTIFPNNPTANSYGAPTLANGQPYFSQGHYTSSNGTAGLKFQPVSDIIIRTSLATAFLPPTPNQLVKNPVPNTGTQPITDPTTGNHVSVPTISGGNPDLKPQNSKSFDFGVVWQPSWKPLEGLRFDAEYYKIKQFDAIGSLTTQQVVSQESLNPERVTRDASGNITLVDTSLMNLYRREAEGWDLTLDYTRNTPIGTFFLHGIESIALHLKNQSSITLPITDAVDFPSEGGANRYKGNYSLTWQRDNWTVGWTTHYYSSYKEEGAAGGPLSVQNFNGQAYPFYITAEGKDTIAAQAFHDVFASYSFGKREPVEGSRLKVLGNGMLDGVVVQVGVRNVFDKAPAFDAAYPTIYYTSPFGDLRMRSYWISVRKEF